LGSRALIGDVDGELLQRRDGTGVSLEQAIRDFGLEPDAMASAVVDVDAFAYVEFHIEQGPVLDSLGEHSPQRVLGIVETIIGQTRAEFTFIGEANHAGTTPMTMRHDALAGAAEWVVGVEALALRTERMVATVGEITARPGAANVVPGKVMVSLDLRHAEDAVREGALDELVSSAKEIARRRGLRVESIIRLEQRAVSMDASLVGQLAVAVAATGSEPHRMVSGAGHDAMVMAAKVPAALLFVRSPGGVSHHPDETVLVEDVRAAFEAGLYFLDHLHLA
jgi:allantoate deiminase